MTLSAALWLLSLGGTLIKVILKISKERPPPPLCFFWTCNDHILIIYHSRDQKQSFCCANSFCYFVLIIWLLINLRSWFKWNVATADNNFILIWFEKMSFLHPLPTFALIEGLKCVCTHSHHSLFCCCSDCRQWGATFFFLAAPACIKAARWWQCCYGQKWNPSCSVRVSTTVQHSVMQCCSAQRDAASSSLWMLGENELSWVKSEGSCSVYIFISQRWCLDVLNVDAAERKKNL